MTATFEPRLDILPEAQRSLWAHLREAAELGFVLYGGTAIALRLGHRQSVDFDFFTDSPLDRESLRAALPFIAESQVIQDRVDTCTVLWPSRDAEDAYVKVSFFGNIGMGRVGEPAWTSDGTLQAASLDDLMATKVKVILQRLESKDYRDVAAMLRAGVDLSKGLASARQLFGQSFQPSEALKALVYFEGGDLELLDDSDRRVLIEAVAAVRDLPDSAIVSKRLGTVTS